MDAKACPYLGTADADFQRGPAVEYPSFENRCFAMSGVGAGNSLMLKDQATFCLSGSHASCPRFRAARGTYGAPATGGTQDLAPDPAAQVESDWLDVNLEELEAEIAGLDDSPADNSRPWRWLGALTIFAMVFLCGGLLALYSGWQVVSRTLLAERAGSVDTVAAPQAPVYLVLTATPAPLATDTPTPTPGAVLIGAEPPTPDSDTMDFPAAVAPTPGAENAGGSQPDAGQPGEIGDNPGVIVVNPEGQTPTGAQDQSAPLIVEGPTGEELPFDVNQPVPPTRRPTPTILVIPTSTPMPAEQPTWTPVPTPTLGPAVVYFDVADKALKPGRCTLVTWSTNNVREVYYEGLGVNGKGEQEECIDDDPEAYNLVVMVGDGSMRTYTVTVDVLLPTPTPTPTVTWTPVPVYTPTWTPVPPTPTPTSDAVYAVALSAADGGQSSCSIGATCTVTLAAVNQSNRTDDLTILVTRPGPWPVELCRGDGVCGGSNLVLFNVAPGNTGYVQARITIPADIGRQTVTYGFQAASVATNNAVRSNEVTISVEAK